MGYNVIGIPFSFLGLEIIAKNLLEKIVN